MMYHPPAKLSGLRSTDNFQTSFRSHGHQFLSSDWFVLGGAILLGVLIPEIFHPWVMAHFGNEGAGTILGIEAALVGSIAAITIGHVSLSRFTSLPTIDAKTYILPAFLMGYAGVLSGLYLLNILFGRYHFVVSFGIVVAWYFALVVVRARNVRTRVAIVGSGPHPIMKAAPGIDWVELDMPFLVDEVSAIVVDTRKHLAPEWEHFIAQAVLAGIPVHDSRYMLEALTQRVEIKHMADNSFGSLLPAMFYIRVKRVIDVVAAVPALMLVAPVILIIGILISLESKGSPIFRQKRTGFRGKPFTFYKLRSMRNGHDGPHFTQDDDARVTRIGTFIRRHRIDELPQIWNIVRGDMSWIGPRPEAVELAELYEQQIPYYVYRHAVRPGISGWAAVNQGNVAQVDAAMIKLGYDFFYIRHCSLWLDALIFLKSISTVITGFGSR